MKEPEGTFLFAYKLIYLKHILLKIMQIMFIFSVYLGVGNERDAKSSLMT